MANLAETAQWEDGVYQWETDDPVVGGPDGIDNVPTRQLANRTAYLKAQTEAHATADDPHPQYLRQSQGNALYDKTGTASASMAGHLAESDPHPQYLTEAETAALIQQGIGQGTTAPQFDDSNQNATTAFVMVNRGGLGGSVSYSSTATQPSSDWGKLVEFSSATTAAFTATVPSASVGTYCAIEYVNLSAYNVSLAVPSGTFVFMGQIVGTVMVTPGMALRVVSDGGNYMVTSSTAQQLGNRYQTFTNVTASRLWATNYTNSTGRALYVMVSGTATNASPSLTAVVGGMSLATIGGAATNQVIEYSFLVPAGSTYSITASNITLNSWFEL